MRIADVVVAALAAALFAGGCGGVAEDTSPRGERTPASPVSSPRPSPAPSPGVSATQTISASTCPNEPDVVADHEKRQDVSLSGDVDGDDVADEVDIAVDEDARRRCRAFLVVQTGPELFSLAIAVEPGTASSGLGLPSLNGLVPIDDEAGAEIVVDVAAGASTQFAGVFTITGGELAKVTVDVDPGPLQDLFPYGGSAGHMDAVDCIGAGEVVASTAVSSADRYEVERRHFVADDASWMIDPSRTLRRRVSFDELSSRFPEFRSSPFLSCS